MNTLIAISFIVYGLALIWLLIDGAKIRRELEAHSAELKLLRDSIIAYRSDFKALEERLNQRIAVTNKRQHEAAIESADRMRELGARCDSLQAQINVANRAAEHARGVRQ